MARKTKDQAKAYFKTENGKNELYVVRKGLEAQNVTNFKQIFATIKSSNLASFLGKNFYTFDKNVMDPGRFTYNEIQALADLIGVDFEVMHKFIRANQLAAKKHK